MRQVKNGPYFIRRLFVSNLKDFVFDKDEMFICHERGTKKKSESLMGIEPTASQIPVGRSNH